MKPASPHSITDAGWNFDTSYLTLPGTFYAAAKPATVALPQLVLFNEALAHDLGLEILRDAVVVEHADQP